MAQEARAGAYHKGMTEMLRDRRLFGNVESLAKNREKVLNQLVGIAIAWALAIVGTLILLKLVDMLIGLRVTREDEIEGLDVTQHGEEGYDFAS